VGYVHSGYERLLPLVAREAGYASALVIRGVEGGVIPPLNSQARVISYRPGGADESWKLDSRETGIESDVRAPLLAFTPDQAAADESFDEASQERDLSHLAARSAEAGMDALSGKAGSTRDGLVLSAAVILRHVGRATSLTEGADRARRALDSGEVQRRFLAFSRRYVE
jgi:anthranilate phosphoribosyltransferase